ncbi:MULTISPECIES: alpha/beta fold hydrolase [unclassified Mesorhizobium]|uniref:alpha/beta fold hydrolase n=1 Tax=unclassified Mesorhizobium TaxID=325217 RepID=UPI0015E28B35|nr:MULTISPECIES: alpha/beta hydrolase [unclassified Mesorhizobium]MBZ9811258.1 alpha/beta hydrolase [Mesorhizobium sp. ESP-6-2]
MSQTLHRRSFLGFAASTALLVSTPKVLPAEQLGAPPPGFTSAKVRVNGTSLHYVRGGEGPAIILIHGMPEDWTEYQAIMPRLAKRFTVVAVDLPGIGKSAPAAGGYEAASLAADLQAMAQALGLDKPYVVGHDLGGIVTYAYVRRFPESLRGAMILDAPVPGIAGWEESVADLWHIGFIQAPGQLAEKLITGRQAIYFDQDLTSARFTPAQRAYYAQIYDAPQLHAAFEIYRAFPQDATFNAAQITPNPVPLLVAVGEKSFFNAYLATFVEGYQAKGMTRVEGARIPDASHFVIADNPEMVADLIERNAGN